MHYQHITDAIGNTPLIKINRAAGELHVYLKAEFLNPGGAIKDRIAKYILDKARKNGVLPEGGTIVEGTSGNTGMGVAMYAASHGFKAILVISDKMSMDKVNMIRALGAEVVITPAHVEADDPRSYYEVAKRIYKENPHSFYVNQYHNLDNTEAHYKTTAPELFQQISTLPKKVDAIFITAGTVGTLSGIGKYFKEKKSEIHIIGVDCNGSILAEHFRTGKIGHAFMYDLEGIGEDMIPNNALWSVVDDFVSVNDQEGFTMARKLARMEGLFAGGSSGACVAAAEKYIYQKNLHHWTVVAIAPDHGNRYLSKLYNDEWMKSKNYQF